MFKPLFSNALQFFEPDTGANSGGDGGNNQPSNPAGNGDGHEAGENGNGDGQSNGDGAGSDNKRTYDRGEMRRMMSSAIDKFKTDDLPKLLEKARQEGEQRGAMSAAERAKADEEDRENALNQREAELNHKVAVNATHDLLVAEGLPTDFVEMLSDSDDAKRRDKVATFKRVFNKAVHEGVLDQMKGKSTPGSGNSNGTSNVGELGKRLAEANNTSNQTKKTYF